MERFTVSLERPQYQNLEAEADERGVSKSQIVREALDARYGEPGENAVSERLRRLEQRLDQLGGDAGEPRGGNGEIRACVDVAADGWHENVAERREAGVTGLELLRDGWTGTGGEMVQAVRESGAGVPSQNDQTMWRRTLRPVCQAAEDRGLVEQESGTHVWEWVG